MVCASERNHAEKSCLSSLRSPRTSGSRMDWSSVPNVVSSANRMSSLSVMNLPSISTAGSIPGKKKDCCMKNKTKKASQECVFCSAKVTGRAYLGVPVLFFAITKHVDFLDAVRNLFLFQPEPNLPKMREVAGDIFGGEKNERLR